MAHGHILAGQTYGTYGWSHVAEPGEKVTWLSGMAYLVWLNTPICCIHVADVVDRIQRQRAEEGRPDYGVKVELQCCDQSCVLTLMGTNPLLFRRLREQREFHQQRLGSATSDAGAIPLRNPNTGKDTMFGHTAAGKVDPSR